MTRGRAAMCRAHPAQGLRSGAPRSWMALLAKVVIVAAGPGQLAHAAVTVPDRPCELVTYQRQMQGEVRTYAFDGSRPFINPGTGKPDVAYLDFDGRGLSDDQITNGGSNTAHISKVFDPVGGQPVTRVQVFPEDRQRFGYRTQLNAYAIEPYRHYVYELEFKLDPEWNFEMPEGAGVLWQVKGHAKPYQTGHAVMSLGVVGHELRFTVLYPAAARRARQWPSPVAWGRDDYARVAFPVRPIDAGRYHRVRIAFYPDDRPRRFGGNGYARLWLDGRPWIRYAGPTLHPDQLGPHRVDFGWYQWAGRPQSVRTVYFRTAHLYERRRCM